MMHRLALRYPEYGWERNAGYATREHRDAIRAHGLTPHHRSSWQALQVLLAGDQLSLFGEGPAGDDEAPAFEDHLPFEDGRPFDGLPVIGTDEADDLAAEALATA